MSRYNADMALKEDDDDESEPAKVDTTPTQPQPTEVESWFPIPEEEDPWQ